MADFLNGDYESAIVEFTAWHESEAVLRYSIAWLASAYAEAGDIATGRKVYEELLERTAHLVSGPLYLQGFALEHPFKKDEHREQFLDGLRKLGVPDANE